MANKGKKIKHLTAVMRGKLIVVFTVIICLFLILAGRLIYWTVNKGSEFETVVLGQQKHDSTVLPFERGKIYDRNGNILATNEKMYTLILEPKNILADEEYEAATVNALHEYMGFAKSDLNKVIKKNKNSYYVVYKKNMTYDEVEKMQKFLDLAGKSTKGVSKAKKAEIQNANNVKGVSFEESYKRVYPYNSLACRVLGFTSSGNVGNWGIEQYYNEELNGVNGRAYYYFNEELDQEQSIKAAKNGNSVVSTIDMQVQKIIEEKLKNFDSKIGSKVTNILVMNPQNGEILGMASSNPYNLNEPMDEKKLLSLYSQSEIDKMKAYTKEKEAKEAAEEDLQSDATQQSTEKKDEEDKKTIYDAFYELWRNSIISNTNEPGSTYKPFTVAAGLESGVLTGNESYFCTGSLMVGKRNIGCSHVHGNITLKDAVAKSCNVAMMNIAFNEGADTFYKYQNLFGFGRSTGIDLPGEAETKSLVYNASNYSNSITLATNAFGQNFNCTMMQMAAGFCSLINGGNYYRPHIVKQIQSDSGNVVENVDKEVLRKTISEETSATIRSYMQETVESGTGTKAQIAGYTIGGKTGTAEKIPRNKKDYYISFIGFTPVDNPQLLIYVTIDEPKVSFQANAGLAVELEKSCMEEIVDVLGIKPDNATKTTGNDTANAESDADSANTSGTNNNNN